MSAQIYDIELRNVYKHFEGSAAPTLAGVDLTVAPGQIHVLLGYSGVGKSVTLKIILGLLQADSGIVEIQDENIVGIPIVQLQKVRMKFGMLFQNSALFDSLNVFENVAFPLREHRKDMTEDKIRERVKELLEQVELDTSWQKLPSALSGGMRKRAGLARAIALKPQIMLFDEPTTGLDPVTSQVIDDLMFKTVRHLNASALIISHNIHAALRIADVVSMIAEGRIIETASPQVFVKSGHKRIHHFLQSAGVVD